MKQITLLNPVGFTTLNAQIDSAGFETPGVHYSIVTTTNLIEPKTTSADWDLYFIQTIKLSGLLNKQNYTISNLFINRESGDDIVLSEYFSKNKTNTK